MRRVRTATAHDRPTILEIVREAFGRQEEVTLVESVWAAAEHLPDLELVAEEDGRIVGHALHSTGYVAGRPVVALAPLAVKPDRQRQGIGTALMHEGIARAKAHGHPAIVLLGHPGYYTRFGFVPARGIGIQPNIPVPSEPDPFMVLPLDSYDSAIKGEFRYCWD